jgi:cobalt-zinc-cadmium efflux system protein
MSGHHHQHQHAATGARLGWALTATILFVAAEAVVGWWSGSLALLSDAGHNLADALALGLAWYAHALSARAADARRTYGYHRVGVLAALLNAVVLVLIASAILWQAWHRLREPAAVPGGWIMATAAVALALNLMISWSLHRDSAHDVNVRSAYLHMLSDAAASVGVILAGGIVLLWHWNAADAIASIAISGLILWSSWSILLETTGILLEAAPSALDMAEVARVILAVPGVRGVHDLHAWTLGSGIVACSCHIMVDEQRASAGQEVQRQVAEALKSLRISHTTIQLEVTPCAPAEASSLYCVGGDESHGHDDHGHEQHDQHSHNAHADHDHAHDHAHGHDHSGHAHGSTATPEPASQPAPPSGAGAAPTGGHQH